MFIENGSPKAVDTEHLVMRLCHHDPASVHMTGDHIDRIYKRGTLVDVREGHNLVVLPFLRLVMCLLKQQKGYSGLQFWAVGSGSDTWDADLPTPDLNATRLTKELGRVPLTPEEMMFLTEDFEVSSVPTNIIQIRHLFTESDCNGVWREFGIFGGNATTSINSGIMINKRHHPILTKTEDMTVERIMRFTLTLI